MGVAPTRALFLVIFASFIVSISSIVRHLASEDPFSGGSLSDKLRKMQAFMSTTSPSQRDSVSSAPAPLPSGTLSPRVFLVTTYGADPTGKTDSTDAVFRAISDACESPVGGGERFLTDGIVDLGGARINLEGGNYLISRPLQFPAVGLGNLMIHGGTLKASDDFPTDGYLIDFSATSNRKLLYYFEFITLRDLLIDSNYRGGGIKVVNSVRTSIDNCYITHFNTNGIVAQGGHETYIRNSFLGQHITAGGDPGERNFTGTAISLMGNDNAVTDVVIFSAQIGIMVTGQANIISGVHCYNKATGFGGTGIYLKLPGLTQTRIVNSYLDYTSIVAEDPVQLHISNCLFLGDASVVLKSMKGVANGVNIVDNMFSGSDKGVNIVQLDQSNGAFKEIDQVVVDRNNVKGMNIKTTIARASMQGNGSSWTADLSQILLFPDMIKNVQYTLSSTGNNFPSHALRNVKDNKVLIETNMVVPAATVFVVAYQ
ncbi:hypothetical protein Leryth_000160 [Lithospermum erythrorhizon]|uniref:Rhamnogalacturonase A/B/Epimerase-like pectate lyase domain-containing protein n=1 Tax=Lithospermum erythrorhizon TaxID=34254 RepID=A0AAV3R3W5_LITER|nr:hypothetical protein Leryth_000160 [Lithospermum erythrorhizon]